ncbi:MAG TPA: efflux RND transporter periplasmic adaptor subunit [Terriglobales bacterium]|nr:efflux RND transporter periplasmic adaptor subunit [Terriglobales bacterium]
MPSHTRLRWTALAFASALALALAGCASGGTENAANHNSGNAQLFTIPADQMAHVQVLTVEPAPLSRTLRLTGAVAYDSFHTTPVITQVSGPVNRILVVPGQSVQRGQPLLYVASPDYSQLRSNYLKAKDTYALAKKIYARAKDLYDHHAIAEQELEQAESAEVQAQGDLNSAEAALKVLGINDPDALLNAPPSFEASVKAPIDGQVVEQNVAVGQLLQTGATQCFVISNMNTVWIMVNVYQKDLPYVHVGDSVAIKTDSYPDIFHGRISYLGAALDPTTRTLQARIETSNPRQKLKKDMYVTALVDAGTIQNAIAVPDSAVLHDSENQPFVYVDVGGNQFGRRSITVGESLDGKTEITAGLKPGDRIVGDGSLFLQFANSLQR